MSSETSRPSLAEHLGMTEIGSKVQKRLSGGYDIPFMRLLTVGLWLFLKGVVLGRVRRNSLEVVAKMFVGLESLSQTFAQFDVPGREAANSETWVYEYLRKVAGDGMAYYKKCYRKEPESFLDLWLTAFAPPEVDFRDVRRMKDLAKRKIRLGIALQQSDAWLLAGVSFGATFPKLTERMWRQEYEKHDAEAWASAKQHGLDTPQNFAPLPLEEMEQQVLVEVASYVKEYFPELVEPLGLRLE